MDRKEIERAVEPILPAVTAFFQSAREAAAVGRFPEARVDLWELGKPVVEAFMRQPEFAKSSCSNMDFGGVSMPFQPGFFLPKFLELSANLGASSALDWVEKVLSTTSADVRCICPVYGLRIAEPLSFDNGRVQLVPFDALPDSEQKAAEQAKAYIYPGGPMPPQMPATTALVKLVHIEKFFQAAPERMVLHATLVALQKLVDALAIGAGSQTSAGMGWVGYVDSELQAAAFGRSGFGGMSEVRPSAHVQLIEGPPLIEFMEAYLQLPSAVMDVIDIAMARLNQAMRRQYAMDKAVDAAIGLEALLGDRNDKSEITDRLSRRAAILIGGDLEARRQTRAAVRQLYDLRSKVVHTGRADKKPKAPPQEVTAKGIEIGVKAVREIVFMGTMPPWEEWELIGRT